MKILELIKKGLNSDDKDTSTPIETQNMDEQTDSTPIVTPSNDTYKSNENIKEIQSAVTPQVKYPNKPNGLNDDEYEYLLKTFPADDIARFTAPFDPSKGSNVLQRFYESSVTKPTAIDKKKQRSRELIAGIADGIGMITQMINSGKGAYVKERNDFALPKARSLDNEENRRYQQLSQKYEDGLFQSRLRDFQTSLNDYNNGKRGIQGVLAAKQKLDQSQAQFEGKQRFAYDKLAQDQTNKDRDYDLKKKNTDSQIAQRKAYVAQGWSRVADSKARTNAYIKKTTSSGGKNNNYQMIIEANPNDPKNQTDEFGNKVRAFEMTGGQLDQYARMAMSDKEFLRKNPQYERKQGLLGDSPKALTEKERVDMVAAYLKEDYEKGFSKDESFVNPFMPSIQSANKSLFSAFPRIESPDSTKSTVEEDDDDEFEILGNIANL